MLHGPCGGGFKMKSPCLKNNVWSNNFPKRFIMETQTGNDGKFSYKRRRSDDDGFSAKAGQKEVDNGWIVLCNLIPILLFSSVTQ